EVRGVPAGHVILGGFPAFTSRDDHRLALGEFDGDQTNDARSAAIVISGAGEAEQIGLARFQARGDVVPLDRLEIIPRTEVELVDPAAAFLVAGELKNGRSE